jgi:hypothetical protein
LTADNGIIAFLFGPLAGLSLGNQFLIPRLEALFHSLSSRLGPLRQLLSGDPLVGKLGTEVFNGSERILKLSFDLLPSLDLFAQRLLCLIQLVRPAQVVMFTVLDDDLHLTIAGKPALTTMRRHSRG